MAAPVSMILGDFPFESYGRSYEGIQRSINTPWADVPVGQTLNQQQWTGPTSEEVTIKGVMFPHEFPASLSGIIDAANEGVPLMFVSGDADQGLIHGIFTIQGVEEDRSFHDAAGRARKNAYLIKLKRYGQTAGGARGGIQSLMNSLW